MLLSVQRRPKVIPNQSMEPSNDGTVDARIMLCIIIPCLATLALVDYGSPFIFFSFQP